MSLSTRQGAEKVEIWKKLPQNRLQAEIQILLNQWVTNIAQPVTGGEIAISRLFPHPARR
jgi:hypothetical protein